MLGLLLGIVTGAEAAITRTWAQPAGGFWGTPANWSLAQVPDSSHESALLPDAVGACNVFLDMNCTLDGLTIDAGGPYLHLGGRNLTFVGALGLSNRAAVIAETGTSTLTGALHNQPGGTLRVRNATSLRLAGSAPVNDGIIYVNDLQSSLTSSLLFDGAVTLSGAGNVWLYNASPWARLETTAGSLLTQAAGHTIHGLGELRAALANAGTVRADVGGQHLLLDGAGKSNTGIMEATASGWLTLDGVTIENAGGQIRAHGGFVGLTNRATVHGGTLSSLPGSSVQTLGAGTLHDVSSNATILQRGGDSLTVRGPGFANQGVLYVNSTQSSLGTPLRFDGDVTLSGTGSLWIYNASPWASIETTPGALLTQSAGHTIHGLGEVRAELANAGTVRADAGGQHLLLNGAGKSNTGLFEATSNAWLTFDGITVENAGGQIQANGGYVGLLRGATLHGGSLASSSGGSFTTLGSGVLHAVTSGATILQRGGDSLTVRGPQFVNQGVVYVNSTQTSLATPLRCDGDVTLSGSGSIWMYNASPWARLETSPGAVLTQAAGHTIHGLGDLAARLYNAGTVRADAGGQQLFLRGETKTNLGTMKAIASAWLTVDGIRIENQGGSIRADGGSVLLANGAHIRQGQLAASLGGSFYTSGDARLEAVTNAAPIRIPGGDSLLVDGSFLANEGTIYVNHTQTTLPARVVVDGDVALSGSGDMYLYAGLPWSEIATTPGSRLRNLGNTLHGAGDITANLVNSGRVSADWPSNVLRVSHPGFVNLGTVEVKPGAGLVVLHPGGNFTAGTLHDGVWNVFDNATMHLEGAAIETTQAVVVLEGPNSRLWRSGAGDEALAGLRTNGSAGWLTIRNGRNLTTPGSFRNAGILTIGRGSTFRVGATAAPGTIQAGEGFTQDAGGKVLFQVGGRLPGEFGQLRVAGHATLGGVLAADTTANFAPVVGDTFLVMTFASREGAFARFEAPIVNGLRLSPTVYANRVVLTAVTPGVDAGEPPVVPATLFLVGRTSSTGEARFELGLPEAARTRLDLFDVRGRLVGRLLDQLVAAGVRRIDVRDALGPGRGPGGGVYFGRLRVATSRGVEERAARVVLLR